MGLRLDFINLGLFSNFFVKKNKINVSRNYGLMYNSQDIEKISADI